MKFSILILVITLGSGCVRVDTGDALPTLGDQILDLDQARQSGLISEQEFQSTRRKILASI